MKHPYSTFRRGLDPLLHTYNLLDPTPLGRQEDGQVPMGCHHDKYQEVR